MQYRLTAFFDTNERAAAAADMLREKMPQAHSVKERSLHEEEGLPFWYMGAHMPDSAVGPGFLAGVGTPVAPFLPYSDGYEQWKFKPRDGRGCYRVTVCIDESGKPRAEQLLRGAGAFGLQSQRLRF